MRKFDPLTHSPAWREVHLDVDIATDHTVCESHTCTTFARTADCEILNHAIETDRRAAPDDGGL
jgi:hypothetical protein